MRDVRDLRGENNEDLRIPKVLYRRYRRTAHGSVATDVLDPSVIYPQPVAPLTSRTSNDTCSSTFEAREDDPLDKVALGDEEDDERRQHHHDRGRHQQIPGGGVQTLEGGQANG